MTMRLPLMPLVMACFVVSLIPASNILAESFILPVGTAGLVKADFGLALYECTPAGCSLADSSAVTVTELANARDYLIDGLPDPEAGSGTWYELTADVAGTPVRYAYPIQTRTPQSTSAVVSYRVPSTVVLAAGDTLPVADVTVAGLVADPTGANVTFSLWSVSTGSKVLDDVSAMISDIDALEDGTWTVTLRHNWLSSETANLSGFYYGRFEITFATGEIMTVPPAPNSLRVQVYP